MKMYVNDFVSKLYLALNNKSVYGTGAFGAPLTATMKARYNISLPVDPSRFIFDCCGLGKACLGGWNADSSAIYGGTWAHTVDGKLVYGILEVPDVNETTMINMCSDISFDFSNIEVGEAVWMTGHIGFYVGDGKVIEATPAWDNGVQMTACNQDIPGYHRRNWTKHGKLPWVEYKEITPPSTGYKYNGIDISRFQGTIDFQQLKNSIDFCIVKIWNGRKTGSNPLGDLDRNAIANWTGCISAGIPCHPYMFTYAYEEWMVRAEADDIKRWFREMPTNVPRKIVWVDFEDIDDGEEHIHWGDYSKEYILNLFKTYKASLAEEGIELGIYTSKSHYWNEKLTDPWYDANVLKWVAVYYNTPGATLDTDTSWNREYAIWQASSTGTKPGINTNVDIDYSNVDLWGIEVQPDPIPDPEPDPDPITPPSTDEVDELHAQLYSFRGESDIINKLESDIVSLWYGKITPYNLVTALSFSFTLPQIYPANYARFKINGLQYFAFVEVRTLANGLYLYICDIDAGTTGFYQGMFEDEVAEFLYSPDGKSHWLDPRCSREMENTIVKEDLTETDDPKEDVGVVVIAGRPSNNVASYNKCNHATICCVMNGSATTAFAVNISTMNPEDIRIYLPSVIKSYYIRNFPFTKIWGRLNQAGLTQCENIYLFGVQSSEFESTVGSYSLSPDPILTCTPGIVIPSVAYMNRYFDPQYYYHEPIGVVIPKTSINASVYNAKMHLYVADVGIINFKLSDLLTIEDVKYGDISITYRKYFDFPAGNVIAKLKIYHYDKNLNQVGVEYPEYRINSMASAQFPVLYNQNIANYSSMVAGGLASLGSLALGVVSAVSGNALGAVAGIAGLASGVAKIGSSIEEVEKAPASIKGCVGGSIDCASGQNDFLWYEYQKEITRDFFELGFGKPDGSTSYIMHRLTEKGYYQTSVNTHCKACGYNQSIVEGAVSALQGGIRVV